MKYRKYNDYHRINDQSIEEKQCKNCFEWFEINENNFGRDRSNKDGFNMLCKTCFRKHNQQYYQETRDVQLEKSKQRWRDNREELNAQFLEYYYNNKDKYYINRKNYTEENLEKLQEVQKDWRHNNKDKLKGYVTEREQHKKHEISEPEWKDCKKYFGYKCAYCGIDEETHKELYGEQLHKDHAYNEGSNNLTNCVPGCKSCNSKKRDLDFDIWYTKDNPRFEDGFYKEENFKRIVKWLEEDCFKYLKPKKQNKNNKLA